jgi:hypothetical protein
MWIEKLRKITLKTLGDREKIETSGPLCKEESLNSEPKLDRRTEYSDIAGPKRFRYASK